MPHAHPYGEQRLDRCVAFEPGEQELRCRICTRHAVMAAAARHGTDAAGSGALGRSDPSIGPLLYSSASPESYSM
jgi:hypothetical protein